MTLLDIHKRRDSHQWMDGGSLILLRLQLLGHLPLQQQLDQQPQASSDHKYCIQDDSQRVILCSLLCCSLHSFLACKQAAARAKLVESNKLHTIYSRWENDAWKCWWIVWMGKMGTGHGYMREVQEVGNDECLSQSMHGLGRQGNLPEMAQISAC